MSKQALDFTVLTHMKAVIDYRDIETFLITDNSYTPKIGDRGARCFCPVSHFLILSETLTWQIPLDSVC